MDKDSYLSFTDLAEQLSKVDTSKKPSTQDKAILDTAIKRVQALSDVETGAGKDLSGQTLLPSLLRVLQEQGITSGKIAELGGPFNSFADRMPEFDFTFLSIYPVVGDDRVLVADITACDYIPDNSFDVVMSKAVLEHVDKPWLAGKNISRILKPGGIAFHAAPFSYFYHGAPADYWRYTPDAYKVIMSELEPIDGWFSSNNRRKDNWGSASNRVDQDGGEQFAVDAFGGWRENWSSVFVGKKNPEYLQKKSALAIKQVVLDSIKGLTLAGIEEDVALARTIAVMRSVHVEHDGTITFVKEGSGDILTGGEIETIWQRRGRDGVKPSYARFKTPRILGLI